LAQAGRAPEAIPLLKDVLARYQSAGRGDRPAALICLNNLAEAYRLSGQPARALLLLEPALTKWETTFALNDVDALTLRSNLALAYLASEKTDKAVKLLEYVRKNSCARLGPNHPNTLLSMSNLATGYEQARRFDKLLPLRQQVLDELKVKYGPKHPVTLEGMNNLAEAYRLADKPRLALPHYKETLTLMREQGGATPPTTFIVTSNLALCYEALKMPRLATRLFRAAAEGLEKLRFQHEHAWRVVHHLSENYERSGQFGEAEPWRRKGLAVVKERFGPDSARYANHLAALGRNLLRQEKWADAESVLRECLALCQKGEPDHWATFHIQSLLGGALLGQQKYADAEPLLLAGYEGLRQRVDRVSPQVKDQLLREALERLVQFYEATGRQDRAAAYREQPKQAKQPGP
jgi:eukaryotic-like serine/threonine-protein kinase